VSDGVSADDVADLIVADIDPLTGIDGQHSVVEIKLGITQDDNAQLVGGPA
jgi:hypothetical protein